MSTINNVQDLINLDIENDLNIINEDIPTKNELNEIVENENYKNQFHKLNEILDKVNNCNILPIPKDNKKNWKINPNNNFVILFYECLQDLIIEFKLNNSDMVILLELMKIMKYGNHINITQKSLANRTNKTQATVCKSWKKLIQMNIIIKTKDGNEYINPQIINKGNLRKTTENDNFNELYNLSNVKNYNKNSFK